MRLLLCVALLLLPIRPALGQAREGRAIPLRSDFTEERARIMVDIVNRHRIWNYDSPEAVIAAWQEAGKEQDMQFSQKDMYYMIVVAVCLAFQHPNGKPISSTDDVLSVSELRDLSGRTTFNLFRHVFLASGEWGPNALGICVEKRFINHALATAAHLKERQVDGVILFSGEYHCLSAFDIDGYEYYADTHIVCHRWKPLKDAWPPKNFVQLQPTDLGKYRIFTEFLPVKREDQLVMIPILGPGEFRSIFYNTKIPVIERLKQCRPWYPQVRAEVDARIQQFRTNSDGQ